MAHEDAAGRTAGLGNHGRRAPRRRRAAIGVAAAALLVLTGCGTDEQTTDDATGGAATEVAPGEVATDDPGTGAGEPTDDPADAAGTEATVTGPPDDVGTQLPAVGGEVQEECAEVFAQAAETTDAAQEDIWPAFEACGDLEQFVAGAETNPGALGTAADPAAYAENQCRDEPEVAGTPVCESLGLVE